MGVQVVDVGREAVDALELIGEVRTHRFRRGREGRLLRRHVDGLLHLGLQRLALGLQELLGLAHRQVEGVRAQVGQELLRQLAAGGVSRPLTDRDFDVPAGRQHV